MAALGRKGGDLVRPGTVERCQGAVAGLEFARSADVAMSGRSRESAPTRILSFHLVVLAGSIIQPEFHGLVIALRAKRRFLRGAAPRALQGCPQHRSLRAAMPGDPPPCSACYPRASPAGQRLQLLQPFPD